uniref:Docking protein 7 n=1 Tax=Echeneis naucrates TaxID=173247 RepID=A0A665X776_ECHNA
MTDSVVVEGYARLRDGKKWKTRWLVLRKPSPVAGAGVFLLASADSEQISFLFDCIVRGISPTRGPFGLRPVLPDPSTSQTSSEEKLNHEAQELEKRLSMLSHRSSTGDDRSISGSSDASDTSQSDSSNGSRLAIWADPTSAPSESTGATVALQSIEKLPANQGAGSQPATKPPRQLQEIGRQSSSDSGIATGSHSSYSGSFSSYTGSLDITPGEDFGSVFSFSPHLAQDLSPCTCPTVPGHEYQVPTSLRYLYDTPRNLLQEGNVGGPDSKPPTPTKDTSAQPSHTIESAQGDKSSVLTREGHSETPERQSVAEQSQGPARGSKKKQVLINSFALALTGAVFIFPPEAPLPERPGSDGVTYVNIPVSPTSKKQLNYMELELQEPGPGTRGASATKYAQIDITATETAHKVGTQHALGRQEGLHTLELRRKGTPH